MKFAKYVMAALLTIASIGCSTGPADNPVDVNAPSPTDSIKVVLQEIVAKGEPLGSGGYTIQQEIENIKKEKPDLAAKLQPMYDEIITLNNPSQLKAKAQEMLDAINSAG
jgi:hypothetical protein